jgi:hypothetical protein
MFEHQESTVSSSTVYEMRQKGRKRPGRQDSVSIAGTSQLENTGTFTKNDYSRLCKLQKRVHSTRRSK